MSNFDETLNLLDTEIAIHGEWLGLPSDEWDFELTVSSEHGSKTLSSLDLVENHDFFSKALVACLPEGVTDNMGCAERSMLGKIDYMRTIKLIMKNRPLEYCIH